MYVWHSQETNTQMLHEYGRSSSHQAVSSKLVLFEGYIFIIFQLGCYGSLYALHHARWTNCRKTLVTSFQPPLTRGEQGNKHTQY